MNGNITAELRKHMRRTHPKQIRKIEDDMSHLSDVIMADVK